MSAATLLPQKPHLRGWFHLVAAPLALAGGLVLAIGARTIAGTIGGSVWLVGAVVLFTTSAIYHRGRWGTAAQAVLRRLDHANIAVFIAATYTPLALLLLTPAAAATLLTIIWSAAAVCVVFRVFWLSAPRWLYVVLYVAMGWAAIGWMGQFWSAGGPWVVGLMIAGGLLYTVGALAYATKRPNPSPAWFGFHEIFHLCTVLAACAHYAAIAIATFR